MDNAVIYGTILGSVITLLGMIINNYFQFKREKSTMLHNERLLEKRNDFELVKEKTNRKSEDLKNAHLILSWFENEYNKTSSIIDYESGLTDKDYNKKYRDDINGKLNLLKYYIDTYYPDLHERIDYLDGYFNQFWGFNQLILKNKQMNDKKHLTTLYEKITEIENLIHGQIGMIKMNMRNKNAS